MCGIFGIINTNGSTEIHNTIIAGLVQLQNRGYDSSGLALLNGEKLDVYKYASDSHETSIEKLLKTDFDKNENIAIGIGHNRWATHGGKNDTNAHPHVSNNGTFALVHNGIIENYMELKEFLQNHHYIFHSQTDTEIIVNLISYFYSIHNNTYEAIQNTIYKLQGTYGLIIINVHENDRIYCVKKGSPLLVGITNEYGIITSEQSGFCNKVNTYVILKNNDICILKNENKGISIQTLEKYVHKAIHKIENIQTPDPYPHWTLKEIYEQPNIINNTINCGGRIKDESHIKLGGLEQNIKILCQINNLILLGCGTSYHAALYGMHYIKQLCGFNCVQVFDGADFCANDIPKYGKTGAIFISQSGETRDLYQCIEIAKNNNIFTIGVVNVVDSLIAREVDCGVYCNAGREIGVASTKSFTSQVVCLSMIAIWFSQIHDINEIKRIKIIKDLCNLSNDFKNTLNLIECKIKNMVEKFVDYKNMFLLGKASDEYVAKEGALKIKEITYLHAEGYSASSLKHGPFALLDEQFIVILLGCYGEYKTKIMNCYQEIYSRNSPIIFITNEEIKLNEDSMVIEICKNNSYESLLAIIPLQLFAYYLSVKKGINPDIPRNLAKVVSVE